MALELERARRVAKLPVSSGELSQGEQQRTSRFVWRGATRLEPLGTRCGVRCRGVMLAGKRCCVTSSSLNAHARPLQEGGLFCVHHAAQATTVSGRAAAPSRETAASLAGEPASA